MKLRTLVLPLVLVTAGALVGCSPDSQSSEPAATVTVTGMAYQPADITVKVGDTVEWVFDDGGIPHDVAGEGELSGQLQSDLLTEGTYSFTFETAGEFTYHCTPHPSMVGTVTVEE